MRRGFLWILLATAACGGASDDGGVKPLAPAPVIDLEPDGAGWSGEPVHDELDEVSNNGFGYTGEIDRYEITIPSDGRLQVTLEWAQEADLDLIVASDPEGKNWITESTFQGFEPELVKLDVVTGQRVWIFVAGWEGDPGDYTLGTLLLPSSVPAFEMLHPFPDGSILPRNMPFVVDFTEELDPGVDIDSMVHFVGFGKPAGGHWCISTRRIVFFPHLPLSPDDEGILLEDVDYSLQFPSGPRGPRSIHGEYLDDSLRATYRFHGWADFDPNEPPRVIAVEPDPFRDPWFGEPIVVTIDAALDPSTIAPQLSSGGIPVPTRVEFVQAYECDGVVRAQLRIEPVALPVVGSTMTLDVPGTIRSLAGDAGVAGAAPAPAGSGYRATFVRR